MYKDGVSDKAESADNSEFVLSRYGIWLKKNWLDATFNYCYRGVYSSLLTDFLSSQEENFSFIDIGANQGLYSLIAAQEGYCTQVMSFEPVHRTFTLLEENIQANSNSEKIRALRLAISDQAGSQTISVKPGHSGAATLRKPFWALFRHTESIETIGPEKLEPLKPDDPQIIKIDVEGHEEVVMRTLAGAGYLDSALAVFFEVDDRWSDAENLMQVLREFGITHFTRTKQGKHYDLLATRTQVTVRAES